MLQDLNASQYLFEVAKQLSFSDFQTASLVDYSDSLLKLAYTKTQKANPNSVFAYFEAVCKREAASPSFKKDYAKQDKVRKSIAWVNTEAIAPESTVEFLKREIENFKNHSLPEIMTGEGMLFYGFKEKMIKNLEEELAKLEQGSTISNDIVDEQPNPQDKEKYLTEKIVVDISKYKDNPQIQAWLETIKAPNYNPFAEEEDFDSPILL